MLRRSSAPPLKVAEHVENHGVVIVRFVELIEIKRAGKLASVPTISNAEPAKAGQWEQDIIAFCRTSISLP